MTVAYNSFFFGWEISLMEWLQSVIPASALSIVSALSMFGEEMLLIVILGFLYWCYDKEYGKYVGLSVFVVNVWNPMIKNVFLRRRPYFESDRIDLLRPIDADADIYDIAAQGYSFPSGHSSNAVTVYGSLTAYQKRGNRVLTVLAVVFPLLVGFSRVAVGAHYPTDVLVGWLLGLATILIVPALQKAIKSRWVFYGVLLLTTLPGLFYCTSNDYFSGLGMLIGYFVAVPFEEKYVNFETTRSPVRWVLRLVGGGAVYFGLNTLLKLPFSSEFLNNGTLAAHLVRTVRYTLVCFVDFAIYPMLFRYTAKLGPKNKKG